MIAAGALSTSVNAATDDARATHQINPAEE